MKCPAEIYQPSPRVYTRLPDIDYPFHDKTNVVTRCGRICLGKKKNQFQHGLRRSSRGHQRGARQHLAGELYGLWFGVLRSGNSSARTARKSVRPKSATYVLGTLCNPCLRAGPFFKWWRRWDCFELLEETQEKPLNVRVYCHLLILALSLDDPQGPLGHAHHARMSIARSRVNSNNSRPATLGAPP